jgi:hypothetical protein
MRRGAALAIALAFVLGAPSARADEVPPAVGSSWQRQFDLAGRMLVAGDAAGAAAAYSSLVVDAPSDTTREVALAQLRLASEAARKAGAMPASTVVRAPTPLETPTFVVPPRDDPKQRTRDELFVLATEAPIYGTMTAFFLDSLPIRRRGGPTVGVPLFALGITGMSGLAIAMIDGAGGLRYGVPQSISTGLNTGAALGAGLALFAVTTESANGKYGYRTSMSFTWGLATAGGIAGGILASTMKTTPGRSAWVGSTGMVSGLIIGGIAGAVGANRTADSLHAFGIASALGVAFGVGAGLATAGLVSPGIGRVRFIDLAWLSGGGIGLGTCIASGKCSMNGAFTALTIGTTIGAVAGFLGTLVLGKDLPPGEAKPPSGVAAILEHASPYVAPENGGATLGVSGQL